MTSLLESLKGDLTGSERTLLTDKELAAKLAESYGSQSSEWQERQQSRAEEVVVFHYAIKLWNDDDACELFEAALLSPSLVQVHQSTTVLADGALDDFRHSPKARRN